MHNRPQLALFLVLAACGGTTSTGDTATDESSNEESATPSDPDTQDLSTAATDASTSDQDTRSTHEEETSSEIDDHTSATETSTSQNSETSSGETDETTAQEGPIGGLVRRYDFRFDLSNRELATKLTIDVKAPGGTCYSAQCEPDASMVTWNGGAAESATVVDDHLVACGEAVAGGHDLVLGASTLVPNATFLKDPQNNTLDVGFTEKTDLAGGTFSYLMSWIGGCKHFGACDAHPARLAEFHYEITHDAGQVVLCPGKLSAGATLTTCDLDLKTGMALAPTYTGVMIAADTTWKRSLFTRAAGVDLVFYEAPGGTIQSSLDADEVAAFFTWITDLLGPYPYGDELRFAGAPTFWLGLEHPGNIILQDTITAVAGAYTDTTMHVLMHETAHQWSGDRTTIATAQDFAWKEATAEYVSYLFEEEHGDAAQAARTREFWEQLAVGAKHYPRPLDTPELEPQEFYGDAYGAGPIAMYLQLEALLGRDAVLEGLQNFLRDPGVRSVADLRDELEAASGENLGDYFDAWVFGTGAPAWPTFEVTTRATADGKIEVELSQSSADGKLRGCVVEVEVQTGSGSARARVDFGVAPTSATASATVDLDGTVSGTTIDPDHRVINRDPGFTRASTTLPVGF